MDAILLLGAVSGDVMQAEIYADDIERVRNTLSPEGLAALERIDAVLRLNKGLLTGPALAYLFSAGPVATIEDVIYSAANPVTVLKPGLEKAPHWDEQDFDNALRLLPLVHTALIALRDSGFSEWYEADYSTGIQAAIAANLSAVQGFDIIPEQERLLGRALDPRIEILIVKYAKPYGIRITGQRFVAYYEWEASTQLRIAAHEIFHPPYDPGDQELAVLLSDLEQDTWMSNIVEHHDPRYGYNSFDGVIDEDSTQALDQIVSERLGFARDPVDRWHESDGGMHLFAAAAYQAMKEDGFADSGGQYSNWLKSALRRDLLSPAEVRRRAALVLGRNAVDAWYDIDN
jgi:hypothetical protein